MLSCHISFLFSLLSGFQVSQVVERRPYLVFDPADASLKPKPLLNTLKGMSSRLPVENVSCTTFPSFPWNPGNKNWNKTRRGFCCCFKSEIRVRSSHQNSGTICLIMFHSLWFLSRGMTFSITFTNEEAVHHQKFKVPKNGVTHLCKPYVRLM